MSEVLNVSKSSGSIKVEDGEFISYFVGSVPAGTTSKTFDISEITDIKGLKFYVTPQHNEGAAKAYGGSMTTTNHSHDGSFSLPYINPPFTPGDKTLTVYNGYSQVTVTEDGAWRASDSRYMGTNVIAYLEEN